MALGALGLLIAAAAIARGARRRSRSLALPQGSVDATGLIVPDDGSERVQAPGAALASGQVVLFETRPGPVAYRKSGAPVATKVVTGPREALRQGVLRSLRIAAAIATFALVVAAYALCSVP